MTEKTYNDIVARYNSGTIAKIETTTVVRANKKSKATGERSPYGEVRKRETRLTHLGVKDYAGLVNAHRVNEGLEADFTAKAAKYRKVSPFLGYMNCNDKPVALVNDEGMAVLERHYFTEDGTELVGEKLDDFKTNYMQISSNYNGQGTDAKVRIRTVYLDNIKSITIGGETFR